MSYGTHRDVGDVAKREAQYNAAVTAAATGFATGVVLAAPLAFVANRTWPAFRRLTPAIKTSLVFSSGVALGVIRADKAGIAFDQEHYSDKGAAIQRRYQTEEEREWDQLSFRDKALTWTKENKFGVVAGSWVTSLGLTFAYIQTQPLSFAQKLVQARVWAQGLTLASLVGMAAITQIPSEGDKLIRHHKEAANHSWRDFIGDAAADKTSSAQAKARKEEAQAKGQAAMSSSQLEADAGADKDAERAQADTKEQ
ncbi:Replication factor C, subunit RFC4 [Thecaphora frezii]